MFRLSNVDLNKRIISFGDGPASFNSEMNQLGKSVISIDPIYQFSEKEIQNRIIETREVVLQQLKDNRDQFIWSQIEGVEELEEIRMSAMQNFLADFEKGKSEKRYISHALPDKTPFSDKTFDLAISSHFLLLYTQLGLDFHLRSITEMLRVAKEIRIFPIINLNGQKSEFLEQVISHFSVNHTVKIKEVEYEFQKGGNEMLIIN